MRSDLEHVSKQRLVLTRHSGRAPTETSPRIRGHRSQRPLGCCNIERIATPGSRSPASFSTTTAHRPRAPATPTGDRHYRCGQRAHSIDLRRRICSTDRSATEQRGVARYVDRGGTAATTAGPLVTGLALNTCDLVAGDSGPRPRSSSRI
ncbi:hypothetical protein K466DRAFT_215391 [Polyporus arcularius HHB13444]|uniref:Uncharacterized protein n=1 Tax=Polyporus arcularius HHB13444 TaxID=1314778 RepID=A0A5C3P4Y3_9APHY|nr:hypothetical protein K466DRAFT_215391 [Polyporus arcularius HHB13444]